MRQLSGRLGVLISIALLLLAFLAPACSEKSVSVDVDEIVARALAAPSSIVSYRMDYTVTEDIEGTIDGEQVSLKVIMDFIAAVDETNRKLKMDMTMDYEDLLQSAAGMEVLGQELVLDDEMYLGYRTRDGGDIEWTKTATDIWEKSEMIAQQLALLKQAEPECVGEEEVDGVACYVLEMTPDVAKILSIYTQQGAFGDDVQFPRFNADSVKSAKTKQWIARDTSRIMKADVAMTLYLDAGDLGQSFVTGGVDMEVSGEMLFHHYNEPVSIELPPEAIEQTS